MKKKVRIRKQGHYRPHAEFVHASETLLSHVQDEIPGHRYSLLSSFMLSAFAFEAYMNYVGPKVERGWRDFDRSPIFVKLRHVFAILREPVDFGREPFQTLSALFDLRNQMAHPRGMLIEEEYEDTLDEYEKRFYEMPQPDWLEFANEPNARKCLNAVIETIELVNSKLETPDPLPLSWGSFSGSAGP